MQVRDVAWALGLTVLSAGAATAGFAIVKAWGPEPMLPAAVVPLAGIWAVVAVVVVGITVVRGTRRGLAWVAVPALPLGLLAAAEILPASVPPMLGSALRLYALDTLAFPIWAWAVFVWVGGPRHVGWRRAGAAVAWTSLAYQAVNVGMQFLLPGVVLFVLFALLPIVAARDRRPTGWARSAVRGLGSHLDAAAVVVVGVGLLSSAAFYVTMMLVQGRAYGDLPGLLELMMNPTALDVDAYAAAYLVNVLVSGVAYAVAARLYDRRDAAAPALGGSPDLSNPYTS